MDDLPNEASAAQERSRELTRQANALRAEGRWSEALPLSFEALRADPDNAVAAHNLGVLLSKVGRLKEGEAAMRHALSITPNSPMIIHALAHALLAQGRYKEGWPLYEVRALMPELNTGFPRDFPFPRWRGESLAGKRLAIFPEQGLGDQIQFARFLPRLIEQAEVVTLLALPSLERLFRHNFPGAEVILANGATEFPDPDYWITLHDLPGVLGVELDTIPAEPYLCAPGPRPSLPPGFKIGLKTKGNPKHVNDKLRSLPEECAKRLQQQLPGTVISLEPGESGAKDMADTAAIIDQLDLVVSVDTSVAHVAGALGKPCLLLIAGFSPDWRWMVDRDDSPWYPRHKLFRGEIEGSWNGAVDRLIDEALQRYSRAAERSKPHLDTNPVRKKESLRDTLLRGQALCEATRYAEAIDLFRKVMRQVPNNPAPVGLLGAALMDIGKLEEAERYQRRALAMSPDYPIFQNTLSCNLLAQGRYREAWPLHEGRSGKGAEDIGFPSGVPCPRWKGENLSDKHIVVLPEQGFGDAIQFFRFLPRLSQTGARITLFVQPALVDLFRSSIARNPKFDGVNVRPARGDVRLGNPDYWTTLIDMMRPLDITIDDVPSEPYLSTDRTWPSLGHGFHIGLVTSGNAKHANDKRRSLGPDMAAKLRDALPGVIVGMDPAVSGARDFADTAALIERLDLVVAVDTSVGHLAGALGKPCLLLVPGIATDWRWMRGRDDSPWYSRHRIYWGALDGSWSAAIDRLAADAQALASSQPTE